MSKKAAPNQNETPFELHELFFSKTNKKGIIESGNSIFTRVSEYDLEEIVGAPHNIVRHPGMPKSVFRLFWQTISTDQPIGAYVKNMSKSGSFYWVFAVAWPIPEGYISIRLKPSSGVFKTVQALYETLLTEEKSKSIDDVLEILLQTLNKIGFPSYKHFMATALVSELESRDQLLAGRSEVAIESNDPFLSRSLKQNEMVTLEYKNIFDALIQFLKVGATLKKNVGAILTGCASVNKLTINMAIGSERAAEAGRTLATISNGFKKVADDIQLQVLEIDKSMDQLFSSITETQFQISGARLQGELIRVFLTESHQLGFKADTPEGAEFLNNYYQLCQLSLLSTEKAEQSLLELRTILRHFRSVSEELLMVINGLEIIRISGKIEVARLSAEHGDLIGKYIDEMENFVHNIFIPLKEIETQSADFFGSLTSPSESLRAIKRILDQAVDRSTHAVGAPSLN